MNKYHIRFNHQHNGSGQVWRVFENGREYICKNVTINVPCRGVTDEDGLHWNIVCNGYMMIDKLNSNVIINDSLSDTQTCHLI
jgi:hypothetical protein